MAPAVQFAFDAGSVIGMGKSTKSNTNFNVIGNVNPDGELILSGQGKAGETKFMGTIDIQTGAVVGMLLRVVI